MLYANVDLRIFTYILFTFVYQCKTLKFGIYT